MGLLDRFRKKDEKFEDKMDEGVIIEPMKRNYTIIEKYEIHKPIAHVNIVKSPSLGEGMYYFINEVSLNEEETNKILDVVK